MVIGVSGGLLYSADPAFSRGTRLRVRAPGDETPSAVHPCEPLFCRNTRKMESAVAGLPATRWAASRPRGRSRGESEHRVRGPAEPGRSFRSRNGAVPLSAHARCTPGSQSRGSRGLWAGRAPQRTSFPLLNAFFSPTRKTVPRTQT